MSTKHSFVIPLFVLIVLTVILDRTKMGVEIVDVFLTNEKKDILHALLVFDTLLMGFVMNQFLAMLTNSNERIFNIFLTRDGSLANVQIYKMKIARFLLFTIGLLLNILILFMENPWDILKSSLIVLFCMVLYFTIDFYIVVTNIFTRDMKEFINQKEEGKDHGI